MRCLHRSATSKIRAAGDAAGPCYECHIKDCNRWYVRGLLDGHNRVCRKPKHGERCAIHERLERQLRKLMT